MCFAYVNLEVCDRGGISRAALVPLTRHKQCAVPVIFISFFVLMNWIDLRPFAQISLRQVFIFIMIESAFLTKTSLSCGFGGLDH